MIGRSLVIGDRHERHHLSRRPGRGCDGGSELFRLPLSIAAKGCRHPLSIFRGWPLSLGRPTSASARGIFGAAFRGPMRCRRRYPPLKLLRHPLTLELCHECEILPSAPGGRHAAHGHHLRRGLRLLRPSRNDDNHHQSDRHDGAAAGDPNGPAGYIDDNQHHDAAIPRLSATSGRWRRLVVVAGGPHLGF
jgi:hypothetical protein